MRLFSKIFSILFVLSVLFFLFAPSVKAQCACKSHCSGSEELVDLCTNPYKKYYCCKIHQPTSTPIKNPGASPTETPAGGCRCQNGKCVGNLTKCTYTVVGCPQTCSDPAKTPL